MRSSSKRVFSMRRLLQRSLWVNPASLTLACLATVLSVYAFDLHILELIELKTYDLRFVSQGPEKPSPAGVMVVIDEKSLEVEGRWPWPRSKFAL